MLSDELCPDQDYEVMPAHTAQCESSQHHLCVHGHGDQRGVVPNHHIPQLDVHDAEDLYFSSPPTLTAGKIACILILLKLQKCCMESLPGNLL